MKFIKIIKKELLFFVLLSCKLSNYSSNEIISPSKNYYFITTINKSDKSKNDYADIIVNLYNAKGKLCTLNTKAGDFNKWAIGWDKLYDTIILYNVDIGNLAWAIKNDSLISINLNDELNTRAKELYEQKYK